MKKILLVLMVAFTSVSTLTVQAQLTTTPNSNATALAQVLAGNGVTISNATFTGAATSAGTFTATGNFLGLTSGVILTTGSVNNALGPNNSASSGTDNVGGTFSLLNPLAGATTQDATFLQFDVTPIGNTLSFRYVFGSEEYPEFAPPQNSNFNDAFGFFISGPIPGGGNYTNLNIASLPNTTTPVTINNVNPVTNTQYYIDNAGSPNIQYDGMTTPLFTQTLQVIPCSTYTFILAIADAGDGIYDSGVMLQENSLSSTGIQVTSSLDVPGFTNAFEGCVAGRFTVQLPAPVTTSTSLSYTISGTATNGSDYLPISGSVGFGVGASTGIINIVAIEDFISEGAETVTISILNPCDGTVFATATLNIEDVPALTVSANPNPVCNGAQVQLQATGGTSYVWSPSGGLSNPNIANPTATTTSTSTYDVTVTWGTCTRTDNVTVDVYNISVTGTATPATVCPGDSVALNASATTNSGGSISYQWGPPSGINDPSSQNTYTFPNATTIITVTATESNGCTAAVAVPVNVFALPPVSIGTSQTFCPGAPPVTLSPSGGPYSSYDWGNNITTSTISVSTSGTYQVTVVDANTGCDLVSNAITISYFGLNPPTLADTGICPGETVVLSTEPGYTNILWSTTATTSTISVSTGGTFYYTANDANGCSIASDTISVTMGTPPAVNASASPDTICLNGTSTLSSGAAAGLDYLWLPTNELTSSITVNQPGTYIVRVRDNFCPNFDTLVVSQYPTKIVTLNNDTTVCQGATVVLAPSGAPYNTYSWTGGPTTPTLTVTAAGDYTVTVFDGQCTYVSDVFTLSFAEVVTPQAFNDTTVCAGSPVVLTSQSGFSNYVWSNQQAGATTTTTQSGIFFYTATDTNGCSVTSDSVVVTHKQLPVVNVTATPNAICVGQGATTIDAGNQVGATYLWQPGGEVTSSISVNQAGTYSVVATLNGCTATGSTTIIAVNPPVISLDPTYFSCCQTVVLDPASGQQLTYIWSNAAVTSTISITGTNNTEEGYSVTATSLEGCTATASTSVTIKCIDATVIATPDTIFLNETSQLEVGTAYLANFTYSWTPTGTLTDPNIGNPVASPTEQTTYTVVVTDPTDNCVDTASVVVYLILSDKVAIPNAFTPNGDGKNDVFFPILAGNFQEVTEFRIYNRWGQLVHNSNTPWDGTFDSKTQPAGTFVYYTIIRVPDQQNAGATKDLKFQGSFSLLH
jgi:gliding motility-associated-like protein